MNIKIVKEYKRKEINKIKFCDKKIVKCIEIGFKNGKREIKMWEREWKGI